MKAKLYFKEKTKINVAFLKKNIEKIDDSELENDFWMSRMYSSSIKMGVGVKV